MRGLGWRLRRSILNLDWHLPEMCTLSIIELGQGGYRAVQNRDEQRSRGLAYPPAWRTLDSGVRVQYPTDSDAGGTWIVVSDAGVTAGVLNFQTGGKSNPEASRSRGEIPLMMIEHGDLESMLEMLEGLDLSVYACFTGFGVVNSGGGVRMLIVQWDGEDLHVVRRGGDDFEPVVVASSGLGDELVQGRVGLFDEMVAQDSSVESQDAFHWHRWDDEPEYSVMMSRRGARTVSVTTIEVGVEVGGVGEPMMGYQEIPENDPAHDPVGAGMLQ